jgi:hypothetical protein
MRRFLLEIFSGTIWQWQSKNDYVILAAMLGLDDARRREWIERVSAQLIAWNLREPAIVFLTMHAPLAFLGSQFLIAAQPFVGMVTGDTFAREFALLLEDPQNVEQLVTHLEQPANPPNLLSPSENPNYNL